MSRLFNANKDDKAEDTRLYGQILVNNITYTNSAAKFWYGLIEEMRNDFPTCTKVELSTSTPDSLTEDILSPELALERDLERLMFKDISAELSDTIAALEIFGPPPPVHIQIYTDKTQIISRDLSQEIMDAEIFSYLAAWLLKWAEIPLCLWNNETLNGTIVIQEMKIKTASRIRFEMKKQQISEGLYRKSIKLEIDTVSQSPTEKTTDP